jgi:hypothetical protein
MAQLRPSARRFGFAVRRREQSQKSRKRAMKITLALLQHRVRKESQFGLKRELLSRYRTLHILPTYRHVVRNS